MNELGDSIADFEKQDIKSEQMTFDQLDQMKTLSGSYESLFSRKAMKYRSMGLGEKKLTDAEILRQRALSRLRQIEYNKKYD